MRELALFAGAGGGILGGKLLGWRTVCAVELDAYCARRLCQRQNEGHLPPFPIWDDVRTFDGRPWRGLVDVVSGGFPCQDISSAGTGDGLDGERSGLWREMARVVREVRPRYVFVENSPMLTSRGLGVVLGDLAAGRFDAEWDVLSAELCGARHLRERIWIVAHAHDDRHGEPLQPEQERGGRAAADAGGYGALRLVADANGEGKLQPQGPLREERRRVGNGCDALADTERGGLQGGHVGRAESAAIVIAADGGRSGRRVEWPTWGPEPDVGRVAHGVAAAVDRIRAIGNGQVPRVVATAWRLLRP